MTDPVLACAAGLLVVLSTYRFLADRRRDASPARRYTCCFSWCFGAFLALMASGQAGSEGVFGLLADLLKMSSAGYLALAAVAMRRPEATPRTLRRRSIGMALAMVAAAGLYFLAGIQDDGTQMVPTGVGGRVALAGFDLVITGYAGYCLVTLLRQTLHWTRQADTVALRTALRLISLTTAFGLLWVVWGLDDVIGTLHSGRQQTAEDVISLALGRLCAVLLLAGATTLLWARAGQAVRQWRSAYRSYRALRPLWSALHTAFPQIALTAGRMPPADAEFALYRRVIEIRDGLLILRRYRVAAETPPESADAARTEAAHIADALTRAQAPDNNPPSAEPHVPHTGDIEAETRWLAQVAQALRTMEN
ncbi:MAB_1171c family putative transporter [Kitasatospora brasiliensis]|uniref:MAB_1171c family putative transporter n=1 Tax=Kitasatospora brasiliensis TaxID=3058040 RepID=UPI0029309592|nr:MAB_1171c family putative transporter [Kitasatospora sp. K002]